MSKTFLEKFEQTIFNNWIVSDNYYLYLTSRLMVKYNDILCDNSEIVYAGYYVDKNKRKSFLRSNKIIIKKNYGLLVTENKEKDFNHDSLNITLFDAFNTYVLKDTEIKKKLNKEFSKYLLNE